jgi:hypothetical protein
MITSYGISPYSVCENGQSANILQKNLCFVLGKYEYVLEVMGEIRFADILDKTADILKIFADIL